MILWLIFGVIAVLFFSTVFIGAPYVPSHQTALRLAFTKLYPLGVDDVVVDLGSGDGIVLREVSRHGAHAVGVEVNPILVLIARGLSLKYGKTVRVVMHDMWSWRIPDDTTVVYAFSVSRDTKRLRHKVQQEANRLGRSLQLITYGAAVMDLKAIKSSGGHRLYEISPLQRNKAQV